MQGYSFHKLFAWLVSLRLAACIRTSAHGKTIEGSSSEILTFTAITLFLILAILEIDLHREELRALGLVVGEEGAWPPFVGP